MRIETSKDLFPIFLDSWIKNSPESHLVEPNINMQEGGLKITIEILDIHDRYSLNNSRSRGKCYLQRFQGILSS